MIDLNLDELASKDVTHYSMLLPERRTLSNIADLIYKLKKDLTEDPKANCLIFCQKRIEVDALSKRIRENGSAHFDKILHIHADFLQKDRNAIISEFQSGGNNLLIGTSAMARGMDLPFVDLVIHLGPRQHSPEEYVHRKISTIITDLNARCNEATFRHRKLKFQNFCLEIGFSVSTYL